MQKYGYIKCIFFQSSNKNVNRKFKIEFLIEKKANKFNFSKACKQSEQAFIAKLQSSIWYVLSFNFFFH